MMGFQILPLYFSIKHLHLENLYSSLHPILFGTVLYSPGCPQTPCSRGWPNSRSSCLHLPSAGIAGVSCHCLHLIIFYSSRWKSETYRGLPLGSQPYIFHIEAWTLLRHDARVCFLGRIQEGRMKTTLAMLKFGPSGLISEAKQLRDTTSVRSF